jgi:pimeloyl-ACP methyl ester carboxylesterase
MKKQIITAVLYFMITASHLVAQKMEGDPLSHAAPNLMGSASSESKKIQLSSGVNLEYVEQGNAEGIPVILLHGYTDSWRSFEMVLPHLPASLHVFALTQRGHGNSAKPGSNYHPTDMAADIAAFMFEKKTGPAVIVGHSMGGIVAQQFALSYPALTKAVVLVSTAAAFNNNTGIPEFAAAVQQLTDPVPFEFADEFQKSTVTQKIDTGFYRVLVNESLKLPAATWQKVLEGLLSVDYTPQLNLIQQPTLILWGDRDNFCSRAHQGTLAGKIPNSLLIIYRQTGHALHWDAPGRFAGDLHSFINSIQ